MPTSPSSLTMTAVSPMSGGRAAGDERRLAAPEEAGHEAHRCLSKAQEEVGIEGIERPPRQLLGLAPDRAQVLDHGGPASSVAEDVHATGPLVEPKAEADSTRFRSRNRMTRARRSLACSAQRSLSRTPQRLHIYGPGSTSDGRC